MKPYLFFDIDGTLRSRTNYQIPSSTRELLKVLKKKGYTMGIATGRGLYSARMFALELGMDFVISDGGRVVLNNDQVVYRNPIEKETITKIQTFAKKHHIPIGYSNHFSIHSTTDVFSKAFDLDQTILCSIKKEIDIDLLFGIYKIYLWADREIVEQEEMFQHIEHHWLREKLCVIEHRHKDEGIAVMKTIYDLKDERIISFGDDINDITMFQMSSLSVCLGNGSDEAKKYATYISSDLENDGLKEACIHLGLVKEEDFV